MVLSLGVHHVRIWVIKCFYPERIRPRKFPCEHHVPAGCGYPKLPKGKEQSQETVPVRSAISTTAPQFTARLSLMACNREGQMRARSLSLRGWRRRGGRPLLDGCAVGLLYHPFKVVQDAQDHSCHRAVEHVGGGLQSQARRKDPVCDGRGQVSVDTGPRSSSLAVTDHTDTHEHVPRRDRMPPPPAPPAATEASNPAIGSSRLTGSCRKPKPLPERRAERWLDCIKPPVSSGSKHCGPQWVHRDRGTVGGQDERR